jgi:hypothetical protein
MATITPIELYRGDVQQLNFTLESPEDITDWEIVFTLARQKNMTTKLFEKVCDHTDQVNGVFQTVIENEDTSDLPTGRYYWDVWRTNSGEERILGLGTFTINPDVREPR